LAAGIVFIRVDLSDVEVRDFPCDMVYKEQFDSATSKHLRHLKTLMMHLLISLMKLSALAAFTISSVLAAPASTALQTRAENYVGYLVSTFSDVTPAVQFHLSEGNDAGSYTFLNKGQPVLKSTVGTKGVRDVFLAHDNARKKYFMIATGISVFEVVEIRAVTLTEAQISISTLLDSAGMLRRGREVVVS
jgi:hypothetical protein